MTPSREKKTLPSSTSSVFSRPRNIAQWRLVLHQVKVLLLKRQWKECALWCLELLYEDGDLLHPIYASYLHFYTAVSHELIARTVHGFSMTKIPLLESVKESYQAAYDVLPKPNQPPSPVSSDEQIFDERDQDRESSPASSLGTPSPSPPFTPTRSFRHSALSNLSAFSPSSQRSPSELDAIFRDLSFSKLTPLSQRSPSELNVKKPSPLRIFKQSASRPLPRTPSPKPKRPLSCLPSCTSNRSITSYLPPSTSNHSTTFANSTDEWLYSRAFERYNLHLISFAAMVQKHIATVDELIRSTREMQTTRRTGRSGAMQRLINRFETNEAKDVDRMARIEKLKKRGWIRERFNPQKYQDLCARALKEM